MGRLPVYVFCVVWSQGIYFSAYQLSAAYPKFEYTLNAMTFVFLIAVPILTMRVLAEERKQKTDQLLLTSPVSVSGIVMGKISCTSWLFIVNPYCSSGQPNTADHVKVSEPLVYLALRTQHSLDFSFWDVQILQLVCFISSLTESQVIAAVLTFVILFAFYMMNGISSFFSETAMSTCVTFGILIIALSLMIYSMIKNAVISGAVCVIGEVALVIVYVVKSSVFEGGIQKVLEVFNLSSHFENFTNSIFDVTGVLYFLSVIAICIFLTMQTILKRRWN